MNSSKSSVGGNTRTSQISPSIHWFFTLNNWNEDEKENILKICSNSSIIRRFIFQEEIGKEGTPHLQGHISFVKKDRPMHLFGIARIHWEKTKNPRAAEDYCQKEETSTGNRYTNMKIKKPLKIIKNLYDWQKEIVDMVMEAPNDRDIYWYWEPIGGIGKTQFCKYLVVHHNAIVLSGKGSDCKYAIVQYFDKYKDYPEIIIYDIPRTSIDYISYDSLEAIKNGLFFSNKYESCQVIMNSPHLICFANEAPDTSKMSLDRWKIKYLGVEGDDKIEL